MTTEKYLKRMCWLLNTIQSRSEMAALERGRAINMVAPTDGDRVQTNVKDTLGDILTKVVDLDIETQGYIDEYKTIKAQVDSLTGEYAPSYIYQRYALDKSMKEVTTILNVSRSTAYRIRDNALLEFEKKYGKSYKRVKGF